jgi:hypothetical protein
MPLPSVLQCSWKDTKASRHIQILASTTPHESPQQYATPNLSATSWLSVCNSECASVVFDLLLCLPKTIRPLTSLFAVNNSTATSISGKRHPFNAVHRSFCARVRSSGICQDFIARENVLVEKKQDLRRESMALLGKSTGVWEGRRRSNGAVDLTSEGDSEVMKVLGRNHASL